MKNIFLVLLLTLLVSPSGYGGYTANHTSKVSWVKIYNSDVIYFGVDSMPATPCAGTYFVLAPTLTESERERYFSILLTAKVSQIAITVGYDNQVADCYATRPIVHSISF